MLLRFILSNLKYYIHTPKITELQCTQQLFQPGASHYQKLRKLGNLWVCLGEVPALTRTLPLGLSLQSGSQRLPGPAHQATSRYSRLCLSCVLLPQPVGLRRHLPQSTLRMPLPAPGSTARHPEQSAGATPLLLRSSTSPGPNLSERASPTGLRAIMQLAGQVAPGVRGSSYSSLGTMPMSGDKGGLGTWGGYSDCRGQWGPGELRGQPTLHARHIHPPTGLCRSPAPGPSSTPPLPWEQVLGRSAGGSERKACGRVPPRRKGNSSTSRHSWHFCATLTQGAGQGLALGDIGDG